MLEIYSGNARPRSYGTLERDVGNCRMSTSSFKKCFLAGLAVAVFGALTPAATAGSELCVTCAAPDMTYRCNVESGDVVLNGSSLQLYCIRELARLGNHASCSVKRRRAVACAGETRTLVYGAPGQTPQSPAIASTPNAAGNAADETNSQAAGTGPIQLAPQDNVVSPPVLVPLPKPVKGPPKTVEEMAKRAAKTSKKQLNKAGNVVVGGVKSAGKSVGNAAKTTWRCLSSLFTKCDGKQ